jgi:hypothetical protein
MASLDRSDGDRPVKAVASQLGGRNILRMTPARTGGNNRIYRVEFDDRSLAALKSYPSQMTDPRDRLGTEFSALSFLKRHGVKEVPSAIAADPETGFALYEWIEGSTVDSCRESDIDAAVEFCRRLRDLTTAADAQSLPIASEACLSGADIQYQVERRHWRLRGVAVEDATLRQFLENEFEPVRERVDRWAIDGFADEGMDFDAGLPLDKRTLSPADFGFHNTLRREDGTLTFVDLEYFGWDDPVRLVAEFTQHPGMDLGREMSWRFHDKACDLFAADDQFRNRMRLLYPALGLRWCLIMLNEFLPERWIRRIYAGEKADRAQVLARQLEKARSNLARVVRFMEIGDIG